MVNNKVTSTERLLSSILWMFLIAIIVIFSLLSPFFMTFGNVMNIFLQISVSGIIAVGMTFVILTGGIDLSVGSIVAFTGLVAGLAARNTNSILLPILAPIIVGAVFGLGLNGYPIAFLGVSPFIATLASMSIVRGLTFIATDRPIIQLNERYLAFGSTNILKVPLPSLIFIVLWAFLFLFQRYTLTGKHIFVVGDNERAAELTGISLKKIKLIVYTLCGALTGLGTAILTSRVGGAEPQVGVGYELDAIAAVVIGGTSLLGGRGGIERTLVGILIMGIISNGFNLLGIQIILPACCEGSDYCPRCYIIQLEI